MFVISIVFLKKLKILFLFTILLNPCKICLAFPLSSTLSTILSSALNKIHDITTFSIQSTKHNTLETEPSSSPFTPTIGLEVEPIGFKPLNYRNDNNVTHVFDVINSTTESIFYSTEIITPDTNMGNATPVNEWNCHCWNSTNLLGFELECHCEGEGLLRIPQKLHTNIQRLAIANAGLKTIRKVGLKRYSILEDIMITDLREFTMIEPGAFEYVRQLRSIYISGAPNLKYVTAEAFFGISDTLKILRIVNCGLLKVPDLQLISPTTILSMVDLEGNQISKIDQHAFQIKSGELVLDGNQLCSIENYAFAGSQIAKLSLKNNRKLHKLHEKTFSGILNILELDLSSTSIEELPTDGLDTLEILKIQNTHSLRTIPSVYNFKNLQYAYLTHSFHCCAFKFPSRHDPTLHEQRMQYISQLHEQCINKGYNVSPVITSTPTPTDDQSGDFENHFESFHDEMKIVPLKKRRRRRRRSVDNLKVYTQQLSQHHRVDANTFFNVTDDLSLPITGAPLPVLEGGGHHHHEGESDFVLSSNMFDDLGVFHATAAEITPISALCGNLTRYLIDVKCYPTPDALTPCEDVMGSDWLRGSVWVVVLLAVFGNTAVLIVLFSNRSDVTVPKFLMSNLAFADFCMGLYLLLIASIDAHSIGEYFNVAYDWQYGAGCKAAGFLTVFASHLSVFTLTIITLERWFAITYAIYLNKRLKLRSAAHIMLFGWIYAILMAGLPLFGISNYSSTSICLPMEARDSFDIAYLITVLGVNGLAFFVILICYGQIYFSLGKDTRQAARHASRGEMTVAKKMALLVFTNFACWAPIAFFGLTALAGYPLIDVAKSKILLVFFYPLNSCANPYLYAILTAQYRRDLFILLSKYGFCVQRAQQYKMTYSLPATNHTYPVPLIDRNSISGGRRSSSLNRGNNKNKDEAYV